jgi:hypothetical protein
VKAKATAERADIKTRFSAENQPVKTGRPKEARDRLSRAFLLGLADDFEANGKLAIERVRAEDPSAYLRVVASLQPKELEISDPLRTMSDEKLSASIEVLAEMLREKADMPAPRKKPKTERVVN